MDLPKEDDQLMQCIERAVEGSLRATAAVKLLTEAHQYTQSRILVAGPVRGTCLRAAAGFSGQLLVHVDWEQLRAVCTDAERGLYELPARSAQVGLLACQLAEHRTDGPSLGALLSGLDGMHTLLVVRAVLRCQGVPVLHPPEEDRLLGMV